MVLYNVKYRHQYWHSITQNLYRSAANDTMKACQSLLRSLSSQKAKEELVETKTELKATECWTEKQTHTLQKRARFCCHQVVKTGKIIVNPTVIQHSPTSAPVFCLVSLLPSGNTKKYFVQVFLEIHTLSIPTGRVPLHSPVLFVLSSPGGLPSSSSCGFAQSIPCIKQVRILKKIVK